jgi:hypothetical protein
MKNRFFAGFVVALAATATLVSAPAAKANQWGQPINVTMACQAQYGSDLRVAAARNHRDAGSWRCDIATDRFHYVKTDDPVSMAKACTKQYGKGWRARAGDWSNAFSWHCYR